MLRHHHRIHAHLSRQIMAQPDVQVLLVITHPLRIHVLPIRLARARKGCSAGPRSNDAPRLGGLRPFPHLRASQYGRYGSSFPAPLHSGGNPHQDWIHGPVEHPRFWRHRTTRVQAGPDEFIASSPHSRDIVPRGVPAAAILRLGRTSGAFPDSQHCIDG